MVEIIKQNLGDDIFEPSLVLTADTGFSSEANMQHLFEEKINTVIPASIQRGKNLNS
ncbi:MAG: hypothetical protein QS748_14525 [Candidatus Endonucleobacter bathymodioli]|uniref:Transposase n=1 Tax=Candidatus Endonucleibacter bathymodioli TaxID=539814 RepID=A0AA90NTZ9_9GAMM|nr:hypothetical protein [Candidatus Endonucleobacter bathymodioli]